MLAELKVVAERFGEATPAAAPAPRRMQSEPPADLADRIRRDPPHPGVFRFYNKAFRMPERPRRAE